MGYTFKLEEFGDTLYYTKTTESFTTKTKLTFKLRDKYCDYQEVATTCGLCAEKRKINLFKVLRWYQISDTKYLSKFFRKTELEIIEDSKRVFCSVNKFKYISLTRDEYKKAIKNYIPEN